MWNAIASTGAATLDVILPYIRTVTFNFTFMAGGALLFLKLGAKTTIRALASDDGGSVLMESFAGFGIDLAITGFSLVSGAIAARRLRLDGPDDGLALLVLAACLLFAVMAYGMYHKDGSRSRQGFAVCVSWVCGMILFTSAVNLIDRHVG